MQALRSQAIDHTALSFSSPVAAHGATASPEKAGGLEGAMAYQDLGYTSGHSDGGPTVLMGQTQFGGASYNTTHASHNWGAKEIPTPKQMVAMLDQWVVGQPQAKKVSYG